MPFQYLMLSKIQWIPAYCKVHRNESADIPAKEGSGLDQHGKSVFYRDEKTIIKNLSQQENGIKSILTSTQQTATTTWTEKTKSSWSDWEQDTTGWMLMCTVSSRLVRWIAILVTQPQWLANACFKTAHLIMVSGEKHSQGHLSEEQAFWWPRGSVKDSSVHSNDRCLYLALKEEEVNCFNTLSNTILIICEPWEGTKQALFHTHLVICGQDQGH